MATTMMDPLPSCFRTAHRRAASTTSSSTAAPAPPGPALTTTVYETQRGVAALTWSRTMLGLSLRADLRLPYSASFGSTAASASAAASAANDASSSASAVSSADAASGCYSFRIRPWLLWKRRGSRRFRIKDPNDNGRHRSVQFVWDLSHAAFPPGSGAEPCSGFFVAVSVDGEVVLSVGDAHEVAYRKVKSKRNPADDRLVVGSPQNPILLARREHVVVPCSNGNRRSRSKLQSQAPAPVPSTSCAYTTRAYVGGREREIAVDLGGMVEKDLRLRVLIDGRRILQVRRLRWKFRGGELVDVEGCDAKVHISWDVHRWLFPADPKDPQSSSCPSSSSTAAADDMGHGVVVFRFNREGHHFSRRKRTVSSTGHCGGGGPICGANGVGNWWGLAGFGHFGNSDRSTNSSIGGGGGSGKWGRKSGMLAKTRSSSSSSSASSGSSSSVTEWASAEENELRESEGFSLVVSFWKR